MSQVVGKRHRRNKNVDRPKQWKPLMSRCTALSIAQETEEVLRTGSYNLTWGELNISRMIHNSVMNTKLYTPNHEFCIPMTDDRDTDVQVTNETSLNAAYRLLKQSGHREFGNVAVLNFASARHPGGGFLTGACAQEESLCRASALYTCLNSDMAKPMYDANNACNSTLYTNYGLYSPNVPVFRTESGDWLDIPYRVSFITVPAPNVSRCTDIDSTLLLETIRLRTLIILCIAAENRITSLVLGAWGCGVFGNSCWDVGRAFGTLLRNTFRNKFDDVVFAIPDKSMALAFHSAL